MKLSLFALLISLTASAQTGRLGPDFLKGIEPETAPAKKTVPLSEYMAKIQAYEAEKHRSEERARLERENQLRETRAAAAAAVNVVARVQAAASGTCPPYTVHNYDDAIQAFTNPYFSNVAVNAVDFRPTAPDAKFEFRPTVMVDSKSGWSMKDVTDSLARVSKIYAQCGIRIGAATVVSGTYSDKLRPITSNSESFMAYHMPQSAPKPWLFFIDHRVDSEFNGAGSSAAQTTESTRSTFTGGQKFMRASAFLAKDSLFTNGKRNVYTPELVIGHELAHILTDGDHQSGENGDPKNLLADDGKNINGKITAAECAQMRNSPYVRKL